MALKILTLLIKILHWKLGMIQPYFHRSILSLSIYLKEISLQIISLKGDFKFWLLAYFLILFDCAKFQKDWTTFILDILQGSLWIFGKLQKQKTSKGGPL